MSDDPLQCPTCGEGPFATPQARGGHEQKHKLERLKEIAAQAERAAENEGLGLPGPQNAPETSEMEAEPAGSRQDPRASDSSSLRVSPTIFEPLESRVGAEPQLRAADVAGAPPTRSGNQASGLPERGAADRLRPRFESSDASGEESGSPFQERPRALPDDGVSPEDVGSGLLEELE